MGIYSCGSRGFVLRKTSNIFLGSWGDPNLINSLHALQKGAYSF